MGKSADLFELIKSLSSSESAYFYKRAKAFSASEGKHYLRLFNRIQRQKSYDEAPLVQQFSADKSPSHFATLKGYLYDSLLRNLSLFHEEKSLKTRIEELRQEAEILIERKLYQQGLKRLRKAQKLAYRIEYFSMLLELLQMENYTIGVYLIGSEAARKLEVNKEIRRLLNLIHLERDYFELYDQLYLISTTERAQRREDDLTRFQERIDALEKEQHHQHSSYLCGILHYGILYSWYTLKGDYRASYEASRRELEVWESYPAMQKERPGQYIASLCNYMNRCYFLKLSDELMTQLKRLRKIKATSASLQIKLDTWCLQFELAYCELTLDFTNFEREVAKIKADLNAVSPQFPRTTVRLLLYNCTMLYLIQGKIREALFYCDAFLAIQVVTQVDLQRFAHLLHLILHWELGHYKLLEYQIRNYKRYLQSEDRMFEFETLFIKMMEKLVAESNTYGFNQWYLHYLNEFKKLKQNPYEKRAFEYLDIIWWLGAKYRQRTMLEVHEQYRDVSN